MCVDTSTCFPSGGKLPEKREGFGSHQRIESIQRLVQDQDLGIVCDGLGQFNPLPHTLAISRDPAVSRVGETNSFERLCRQVRRLCSRVAEQPEKRTNELTARGPLGKLSNWVE
jgi:hypothetical protein